jgi:Proton-conducting membrane transporter
VPAFFFFFLFFEIIEIIDIYLQVVQNDFKSIIAYSTCSQLGYMITVSGLSSYNVGLCCVVRVFSVHFENFFPFFSFAMCASLTSNRPPAMSASGEALLIATASWSLTPPGACSLVVCCNESLYHAKVSEGN